MSATDDFIEAKDDFIAQWGALGTSWGISRTMAQVHALLMISPEPISTDQCMEELQISRGNAHTNLKERVGWGLLKIVVKKGERKELFEASVIRAETDLVGCGRQPAIDDCFIIDVARHPTVTTELTRGPDQYRMGIP